MIGHLVNFAMGAGIKILSNTINHIFENAAEERKTNALKDSENLKAHIRLAELASSDNVARWNRFVIFTMIAATFCLITIYSMIYPADTSILIEVNSGFLSGAFRQKEQVVETVNSSGIVFQKCFIIMEAVIGAFVVPSRRH